LFCVRYVTVDFVIPSKGESLLTAYDKWRAWADAKVCCDYSFHVAITYWTEQVSNDMLTIVNDKGFRIFSSVDLFLLNRPMFSRHVKNATTKG